MERDLENRVAIVTGAAHGIGRATARRLAAEGARLVVADWDEGPLTGVHEEVHALGGQAVAVRADVADAPSVQRIVDEALGVFNQIDILVNGAGADAGHVRGHADSDEWERYLAVNLTGCLLCCRAVTSS